MNYHPSRTLSRTRTSVGLFLLGCASLAFACSSPGGLPSGGSSSGGYGGAATFDGGCTGTYMSCAGTCIDTSSDAQNCGSCGHACSNGMTCNGGFCQTALVLGQTPDCIAVNATSVYWANAGTPPSLWKAGKNGGMPTLLASASGQSSAFGMSIAVDATSVYWTISTLSAAGEVLKVGNNGGTPTVLTMNPNLLPNFVAVDATSVYWMMFANTSNQGGAVMKVGVNGGTPTMLAQAYNPKGLAIDATSVYWTDAGPEGSGVFSVAKVALDGSNMMTLATGKGGVSGLGVDAQNVYFLTDVSSTGMMQVPLNGGALAVPVPTSRGVNGQGPALLFVDQSGVYSVDPSGNPQQAYFGFGTVWGWTSGSNGPTQIAGGEKFPLAITGDDNSIYLATSPSLTGGSDGEIVKVPK